MSHLLSCSAGSVPLTGRGSWLQGFPAARFSQALTWLPPTFSQKSIHNLQIESGPMIKATHGIKSLFGFGFQRAQSLSWRGGRARSASIASGTGSHLEPKHKAKRASQSPLSVTHFLHRPCLLTLSTVPPTEGRALNPGAYGKGIPFQTITTHPRFLSHGVIQLCDSS